MRFKYELQIANMGVQIKEVYELLSLNYVEDDGCDFRFDYSEQFMKWYEEHKLI